MSILNRLKTTLQTNRSLSRTEVLRQVNKQLILQPELKNSSTMQSNRAISLGRQFHSKGVGGGEPEEEEQGQDSPCYPLQKRKGTGCLNFPLLFTLEKEGDRVSELPFAIHSRRGRGQGV